MTASDVLTPDLKILAIAVFCLAVGIGFYMWSAARRHRLEHFQANNLISWLLIALFPVLILFAYFPSSQASFQLQGVTATGAVAAFAFVWWYGTRAAQKATTIDELNMKIATLEAALQQAQQSKSQASPLSPGQGKVYRLKSNRKKRICLLTGNIRDIRDIDVWVSSENTNMQMARFYDRSISGTVRYLGAKKDTAGNVTADTIALELSAKLGGNTSVQPATVLATESGELIRTHNVKKLLHVAAVQGQAGAGYRPIDRIHDCVTNTLSAIDSDLKEFGLKSVLLPLFGTGTGQGNLTQIVGPLLNSAVYYLEQNKHSRIELINFLCWFDTELSACKTVLDASDKVLAV